MEWIAIPKSIEPRQYLPMGSVFLALWKGAFVIAEFDKDANCFYICCLPAQMAGIMKVDREREGKFTHYCKLEFPKDY